MSASCAWFPLVGYVLVMALGLPMWPALTSASLPFPALPFPSLLFPSLPFPSLPFPSLPFESCHVASFAVIGSRDNGRTALLKILS